MEIARLSPVAEISIAGPPRERGQIMGAALRERILVFLAEIRARIGRGDADPFDLPTVSAFVEESARIIENRLLDIALEVKGLAEGANISEKDAWLLQLWREAQSLTGSRSAGECSLLAGCRRGRRVLAQTVDLMGPMARHATVVRTAGHDGSPEILMYTFAGLLGYLGINSAGLAVGINMVDSGGWHPGVPPYLLVRHLLTLDSMEKARSELERLPRASSRCLTISAREETAQFEMTPEAIRQISGEDLLHTNHYLHSDLVASDRSHVMLRRASKKRLELLKTLVNGGAEAPADAPSTTGDEAEKIFAILSHHGDGAAICCHGREDGRVFETAAAAVMFPDDGELYLRPGTPCLSSTQVHRFRGHGHA